MPQIHAAAAAPYTVADSPEAPDQLAIVPAGSSTASRNQHAKSSAHVNFFQIAAVEPFLLLWPRERLCFHVRKECPIF